MLLLALVDDGAALILLHLSWFWVVGYSLVVGRSVIQVLA